jgi:LPXTG-motif cell wall-anchored protein
LFAAVAAVAAVVLLAAGPARAQEAGQGLVSVESAYNVDETVSRLESIIADRGLTVVTKVNHAANAANVGLDLRPTTLLIFGNPNVGTPLMQSSQTTAIDLPQKFLVWENEAGQVQVSYNDPQYLANRHSISGQDERLGQISNALSGLSGSVSPAAEDDPADTPAAPPPEPTAAPDTPDTPAALPETGGSSALPWLLVGGVLLAGGLLLVWRARRRGALLVLLAAPLLAAPLVAMPAAAQTDAGLISVESPYSVEETVSRLQNVLDENGLITVATLNHAANAESAGLELRPTQLIIFGNPNIGTPLMQSSQTIGIDLPQKFLVWENEAGQVQITYNDPQYLANRHGITDRDDIISQVSTALGNLSGAATAE